MSNLLRRLENKRKHIADLERYLTGITMMLIVLGSSVC